MRTFCSYASRDFTVADLFFATFLYCLKDNINNIVKKGTKMNRMGQMWEMIFFYIDRGVSPLVSSILVENPQYYGIIKNLA